MRRWPLYGTTPVKKSSARLRRVTWRLQCEVSSSHRHNDRPVVDQEESEPGRRSTTGSHGPSAAVAVSTLRQPLREGRQAVITFIDYSAVFDTKSQMFLDEALAEAGVGGNVRRIEQAIFAAATGVVRLRHPDGTMPLSEQFDIIRGHILARCIHRRTGPDLQDAFVNADVVTTTVRVTEMVISQAKRNVMHIHRKTLVSSTTEADVEAMKLEHKCDACSRTFPTQRGLKIHAARWCDGGVTHSSRRGSLANRAVQTAKRRAAEALLSHAYVDNARGTSPTYNASQLNCLKKMLSLVGNVPGP